MSDLMFGDKDPFYKRVESLEGENKGLREALMLAQEKIDTLKSELNQARLTVPTVTTHEGTGVKPGPYVTTHAVSVTEIPEPPKMVEDIEE